MAINFWSRVSPETRIDKAGSDGKSLYSWRHLFQSRIGEQQIHEALYRGLGLVVGQPRALVGLDDDVVRPSTAGTRKSSP